MFLPVCTSLVLLWTKKTRGEKSRWIQAWITHYSPTLLNFRSSNGRHQQIFNTFATNSVCNDSLRNQNRYAVCFVFWKGEWFLRHQHQEAHQQLQALSVSIPGRSNQRWVVRLEWGAGLARLLTCPTWCIWCCKACSNIRQGLFFVPWWLITNWNEGTWHTLWLFWNCSFSNMSYFFAWPKQAGKPSPFEAAIFVNGRRSLISKPEVGFFGVVGKEALWTTPLTIEFQNSLSNKFFKYHTSHTIPSSVSTWNTLHICFWMIFSLRQVPWPWLTEITGFTTDRWWSFSSIFCGSIFCFSPFWSSFSI